MSARLFRNALIYRRYGSIWRGIPVQSILKSYATNEKNQNFHYTIKGMLTTRPIQQMASMFSTTKVLQKVYSQDPDSLVSSMISYYKTAGYVNYKECQKFVEMLETDFDECVEMLTKENKQFLLHVFGTQTLVQNVAERHELFQRLWKILKENKLLTKDDYMQKLQILQYNHLPLEDMQSFLQEFTSVSSDCVETSELFSELLVVACSSGNMKNAMEVLTEMRQRNFSLTEQNFNALILGYGRNHDLSGVETTVGNMKAAGVMLSNETQATLFIAYIENNAHLKALEILRQYQGQFTKQQILKMLRTGVQNDLDSETITLLVRELPADYTCGPDVSFELRQLCNDFLHNGKFDMVKIIISELPKPEFSENQSIDSYAASILTELFRAQLNETEILDFASMLLNTGKNTRALHLVTEAAMHRNPPSSLVYLEALSKIEPLRPHYLWPLMMYNFRRHGENGIITTIRHMQRLNVSCDNETLTFYVLPHMNITLDNPIQGVKMLIDAGVKTSLLLTPVLRHLLGQQKILESLQVIERYPIKIDIIGQLMPALQQISVNVRATRRYHQFAKLLNELSRHNENPKVDFVGQLLLNMLKKQERLQQDLRSFQRFISEMQKIGIRISSAAISGLEAFLKSLPILNDEKNNEELLKRISQTLQQMKNRNIVLTENATSGSNSNTSFIKHPRDMTLSELECHLIELESKGMNARGVLRRLLQLYVRENCLERALEIKDKCDKLHVQESPGMLASIFDMYVKVSDLEKAEATLKKLQKTYPGFQLDEHKFIDYAALLVRENQLERGLQLLADRSAKQRINGGDYVIKNVWNFLTSVAQLAARQEPKLPAERNLTRETFEFLCKHGYCNSTNAVLGPIVREYLLRGDLKSAISEFNAIVEKYKHTPLQFELLSILVRLSNNVPEEVTKFSITSEEAQQLLNKVTQLIANVHGTVNMNSALVLAFAESGTDNQLRRLLINPEFRINHELMQKNCEHLGKEGSVRTLLRLAKGARGLNRTINEQTIYDLLLNKFVKNNDCSAALDLFERLDADDELKISTDFVKNLINLLRVNKMEVPSNVALKAYINRVKV